MSETKPTDWAKLLAGPLVEKWLAEAKRQGKRDISVATAKQMTLVCCADELLAHLRESGIVELLEAGQAMRKSIELSELYEDEIDAAEAWDSALARALGAEK